MDMMNEFDELAVDQSITTEQLDDAVKALADSKKEYDLKKQVSNEAHAIMQENQAVLINLLKLANKKKYVVDGYGTASVTEKLKVKTPQHPEDKEKLFQWLKERHGEYGFLSSASVNYQTLNRIYNEAFEEATENGTADTFGIPGVATPDSESSLSFRRSK